MVRWISLLSGSIATGDAVLAAQEWGGSAYIGSAFIATEEARRSKHTNKPSSITAPTTSFTAVFLPASTAIKPSIEVRDLTQQSPRETQQMDFGSGGNTDASVEEYLGMWARYGRQKPWHNGIYVAKLTSEYQQAKARINAL